MANNTVRVDYEDFNGEDIKVIRHPNGVDTWNEFSASEKIRNKGFPNNAINVTLDEMIYHTKAVRQGATKTPIIADLPINSYKTKALALKNARKLIAAGADIIKIEGDKEIYDIVSFLYQNEIFQAVTAAVKKVLETEVLSPELTGQVRSYWKTESIFTNAKGSASVTPDGLIKSKYSMELSNPPTALRGMARGGGMPLSQNRFSRPDTASINQAMEFTKEMTQPSRALERGHQPLESAQEHATPSLIPVCQIANSYILAHGQEGLVIIDQHAAHERVMYNKFLKQAQQQQNEDPETQKLLVPVELDLSLSEAQLLEENQSILTSIGFEIDHFGGNTFHIHAVPTALIKTDIHTTILEVIDDIKNGDPTKLKEPQHAAICYMACRGAIKFGDPLTHKEMVELIRQMDQQDQKYTCPHGRPTMINLTFAELEKRFGRK